ncbi:hypothetical protein GCM10010451_04810 [Streptomyces virens]|uniref:Uncharacterized protein n=1 Tax=Streptomyces virens TaxID=285572 RepID=A0ABP6NY95_9ACTN|nr:MULTISPECIES: hypothetical protein [Streptomyces]MBA8975536.1 hypothetical protein [Streptomyces calvus]MYS27942.1 hypothetical protein [Streptomyces sp. SID7804]MYS31558.1 hypothetical protein [Streptomyces sp. SID7804]
MLADTTTLDVTTALREVLGSGWEFTTDGTHLEICHRRRGTPYAPPRRPPSWAELLATLEEAFAVRGVPRDECIPLRWGRETELAISAVQALDPFLKDGRSVTYRSGFLPQPVVRLTGERDRNGHLLDGYLTSFVNVSRVQPIQSINEYAEALDDWLYVLSRLGFHARHVSFHGQLKVWHRRQVAGVTLMFRHLDLDIGDLVLLWNTQNPQRLALDLGTGLERLAWARGRRPWGELIYRSLAGAAPASTLDALRTATLLLGNGIMPAARGAGGVARRVLATIPWESIRLGVSAAVRSSHEYWTTIATLPVPWPAIVSSIEHEVARREPEVLRVAQALQVPLVEGP